MTPIRFRLNEELVVKAAVLNAARFRMFYIVLAVAAAIWTAAFTLTGRGIWTWERWALQIGLTLAGTLAITGCLLLLLRHVVFPFEARRNFRQQKALSEEMALSWTDEAFLLDAGKSRTVMPFADLHGYRASRGMILLYVTGALYHLLPSEAFTGPDAHAAFLRKLEDAGVRRR